jgi:hypothetical protein
MSEPDRSRSHRHVIRQQAHPPVDTRPRIRIAKAPTYGKAYFTILSPAIHGYMLHFEDGRTTPCPNDEAVSCRLCQQAAAVRWKGYLAGQDTQGTIWLVEVTAGAFRHCESDLANGKGLRGLVLTLGRLKNNRNAPVRACLSANVVKNALPPEPAVHRALCRIWGIPDAIGPKGEGVIS